MYYSTFIIVYLCAALFLIGTVTGSFCYCLSIRILTGENISRGRSHCRNCNHVLGPLDLVPLFSWIFLKGKCRYCGAEISKSYPLSEAVMAFCYVLIFICCGFGPKTLQYLLLATLLMCICYTDLEGYLIPDRFIVIGLVIRAAFLLVGGGNIGTIKDSLIGAFSVSLPVLLLVLIMDKVLKKESMGGGDIKLLFMTGFYFHWTQNLLSLLFACIAGIITGVYFNKHPYKPLLPSVQIENADEGAFPFGPAIALGTILSMCFGNQLISWYTGLWNIL